MCVKGDSNASSASTQYNQSSLHRHEETLHPWLSKMHLVKILIRLWECEADLNLPWAHIFGGSFPDGSFV